MRYPSPAVVALFAVSSALAQTLPPSPTASVGCEPHGDHWHCDGPAISTTTASLITSSTAHNDHEESETLPPSPTESVGCHPHGNHWHCDGPASTTSTTVVTETSHGHEEDDKGSETTGTLPPSPTESIGCHAHGDHWHCDGPAVTLSSSTVATSGPTSASTTSTVPTGDVGRVLADGTVLICGLLIALGM